MSRVLIVLVDVLSVFKSPMILIAIFSLVMVVGLPYIMDNRAFLCGMSARASLTEHSGPRDQGRVRGHAKGERTRQLYRCSQPRFHRPICRLDVRKVRGNAAARTEAEEKELVARKERPSFLDSNSSMIRLKLAQ